MELRDYQIDISNQMVYKLNKYKLVYLSAEVRTGKTLTSLETCKKYGSKNVLFLTKKKAISSIEKDYKDFGYSFNLTVTNYESVHKVEGKFDLIILDESHGLAAFPKPSKRTILIKKMFGHIPMIFLTGTSSVESGSQWFHQFWISNHSPFKEKTFYQWAKTYVNIYEVNYGNGYPSKKYDKANRDLIQKVIDPYLIIFTQKEAGFTTVIEENILRFDNRPITNKIAKQLLDSRIVKGNNDEILADTPVKLMSKLHQIYNGTCIGESGESILIDDSKAEFIKSYFNNKKIAIFYYFQGELELLKQVFKDNLTTDLEEFNTTDKNIALQQSGLEGLNLSKSECLVYYNFGFSGKNYIQSRDRATVKGRDENKIYFVFERGGISEKIYKQVKEKRSYNIKQFNKEYSYGEANGQD